MYGTPSTGGFSTGGGLYPPTQNKYVSSISNSIGSSRTSSSTKRSVALTKLPVSGIALKRPHVSQNGGTTQQAESLVFTQPEDRITFADFMTCYFPLYKQTIIGYGVNVSGRNANSAAVTEAGNDKSIFIPQGRQAWREYVGLPAYNLINDLNITDTMFDVMTLMDKAIDVVNFAAAPYAIATDASGPLIADTTASKKKRQNLAFCYRGGYQVHTFTNEGTTDIHLELFESQPRTAMTCIQNIGGITTYDGVGNNIIRDYTVNTPFGSTVAPVQVAADIDGLDDMLVRLTPNCNGTHYLYKCTQPFSVMIPPGGVFKYKMAFNPFSFTESEWNRLLYNTNVDTGVAQSMASPYLIPAFTKILCCRFTTEIGHNQVDQTVTAFTSVGYMKGILSHTQTERHECRYMPYQNQNSTVLKNYLDKDLEPELENINVVSNAPQQFNA